MNPRRRRTIVRAILAGLPAGKLNSSSIRKFLEREKLRGMLKLTSEDIDWILSDKANPSTTTQNSKVEESASESRTENIEAEEVEAAEDTIVENVENEEVDVENEEENVEESLVTYSLDNTKSELQTVAENLGISFKKSFSKSKLLELINNN